MDFKSFFYGIGFNIERKLLGFDYIFIWFGFFKVKEKVVIVVIKRIYILR